ncbi:PROF-like protein [Mya arenaria]|uniref:Profilin n=1 Tax=Mya arenaria TaxID=6604 RepID=A0ABY7F109_MYAAR|nr:PROF-like protein [Mya arenaria]
MSGGVHVGGVKYQFLRVEDDKLVLAKKKDQGALSIQVSKTAIVIGHLPEGGQQGNLNKGIDLTMSWDSYIDNVIAQSGTGNCDKACIIGLDGGTAWTTSANANNLEMSPTEAAKIAAAFKGKDFSAFQANGVHVGGTKYQFLRAEDDKLVLAKKKDHGALSIQASKTAIVVGHLPEGGQHGNLNKGVAVIADYLESLNM